MAPGQPADGAELEEPIERAGLTGEVGATGRRSTGPVR